MMKMKTLRLDSWTDIIKDLYNHDDTTLGKILDRTKLSFAYTINVIQILERDKMLLRKSEGRVKYINLTPKGKRLAERVMLVKDAMR
jgi:predicted transcriptional regulator